MKLKSSKVAAVIAATATFFAGLVVATPAQAATLSSNPSITAVLTDANTLSVTATAATGDALKRDFVEYQVSTLASFTSTVPVNASAGYKRITDSGLTKDAILIESAAGAAVTATAIGLTSAASSTLYVRARGVANPNPSGPVTDEEMVGFDDISPSWSSTVIITTPTSLTEKPTISAVTNSTTMKVSWPETSAGGGKAAYVNPDLYVYDTDKTVSPNVTSRIDNASFTFSHSAGIGSATFTVEDGHLYQAKVKVANVLGTAGDYSPRSDLVEIRATSSKAAISNVTDIIAAPTYSSQPGAEAFDVEWSAPAVQTDTIARYKLEWSTSLSSWPVNQYSSVIGTRTYLTIASSTFDAGTSYYFRVTPYTAASRYGWAATTSLPALSATAPGTVATLTSTPSDAQVKLSWTAPANTGSSAITSYSIYKGTSQTNLSLLTSVSGSTLSYDATGLTNGTGYFFKVVAVNAVGANATGSTIGPVVPNPAPDSPATVRATAGNGAVTVTWTSPANLYGQTVTDYLVEYKTVAAGSWNIWQHEPSTDKSIVVNGLANGSSYTFRVSTVAGSRISLTPTVAAAPATPAATNGSVSLEAVTWLSDLLPGSASVVTNGVVTVPTLVEMANVAKVSDSGFVATFRSVDVTGGTLPADPNNHLQVRPGQQVKVVASGFKPKSKVRMYVFSMATPIASGVTNALGTITLVGKLPKNLALGNHVVQLNGPDNNNNLRSISLGIGATNSYLSASRSIKFAVGVTKLNASQMRTLRSFNSAQTALPTVIRVVGYTYGTATKENLARALARAKVVAAYLKKIGVTATIFTTANTGKATKLANGRQVIVTYFR